MRRAKVFFTTAVCLLLAAPLLAQENKGQEKPAPIEFIDLSKRPDLEPFVKKADQTEAKLLEDFNNSADAKKYKQGPFSLTDFAREVSEKEDANGQPYVSVTYRLRNRQDFWGYLDGITFFIYKNDLKLRWVWQPGTMDENGAEVKKRWH